MRLAFFYRDFLGDGAYPRDTRHLAEALARRVEHVFIYCYTRHSAEEGETTRGNLTIRAYRVPPATWFSNFVHIPSPLRHLLAGNDDAVDLLTLIGAFIPANYPVARWAHRHSLPYAVSPGEPINAFLFAGRGPKALRKRLYASVCERYILEHAEAVQLCSRTHMLHLLALGYRIDPERTFIGREAIDWDKIRSEHPGFRSAAPRPGAAEITFGYLGRLKVFHKGLDLLLRAWSHYLRLGGVGRLQLVGPGSAKELRRLEGLRRRLDLTGLEILPPKYGRDKYEYLAGISALVHPSRHDGITRVIREGLATGRPIITTYHTHIYELLEEHRAGYVAAADPLDLAMKMMSFAALRPEERDRMAAGALEVAHRLTWEESAEQFLQGVRHVRRVAPTRRRSPIPLPTDGRRSA